MGLYKNISRLKEYSIALLLCKLGYIQAKDYGLRMFRLRVPYLLNLRDYLEKFLKNNNTASDEYSLFLAFQKGYDPHYINICLDGDYGFILTSKTYNGKILEVSNRALACVSFTIHGSNIVIQQLQAVKGMVPADLRWEKLFIQLVIDWAFTHGYSRVGIIQAKDHKYFIRTRANDLYVRYDVTAKRCGFKLDDQSGIYFKAII